jgi:hypothetical protein
MWGKHVSAEEKVHEKAGRERNLRCTEGGGRLTWLGYGEQELKRPRCGWLTPVILIPQEAEIRRITV